MGVLARHCLQEMQIYSLGVGGREGATVRNDMYSQGPVTKFFVSFHLLYQILWLHRGLDLIGIHLALVRYSHILMRENLKKKCEERYIYIFPFKKFATDPVRIRIKTVIGDTSNDNHTPGPVIREVSP